MRVRIVDGLAEAWQPPELTARLHPPDRWPAPALTVEVQNRLEDRVLSTALAGLDDLRALGAQDHYGSSDAGIEPSERLIDLKRAFW